MPQETRALSLDLRTKMDDFCIRLSTRKLQGWLDRWDERFRRVDANCSSSVPDRIKLKTLRDGLESMIINCEIKRPRANEEKNRYPFWIDNQSYLPTRPRVSVFHETGRSRCAFIIFTGACRQSTKVYQMDTDTKTTLLDEKRTDELSFDTLGLSAEVRRALDEMGYSPRQRSSTLFFNR